MTESILLSGEKFSLKTYGISIFLTCMMLTIMSLLPQVCSAQNESVDNEIEWRKWQVSLNAGTQMSGIKDEDFIKSNFSPLLNVTIGRWIIPSLGIQVGYKGWYFNAIADERKHGYGFYYLDAILNVLELFNEKGTWSKWYLNLHGGGGYFYNYDYMKPNVCANAGLAFSFRFSNRFLANFDASAIMGWDIYQGNADILPGITVGISYLF